MKSRSSSIYHKVFLSMTLALVLGQMLMAQSLERYSTLVDRHNIEEWENTPTRSFDEDGIILNNDEYHPVGIVQYGLLCHQKFLDTRDSVYWKKLEAQIQYLTNGKHTHSLFEDKGIGLPYLQKFKDMNPPWYSGMAQGLGMSLLLRHSELAEDTVNYPIIRKLAHVLLQPAKKGGCLSVTAEELLWIEEYPNSTQSPQVLNGFVFALIGLIEYNNFFPADLRAKRIKEECLSSLKQALPEYDSNNWSRYSRRVVYPNREMYMRVQIFQMKQLYEIVRDPFFLRQLCIWSAFIYDVPPSDTLSTQHFSRVDISIPGKLTEKEIIPVDSAQVELENFEQRLVNRGFVNPFPWYCFTTTNVVSITEAKELIISLDTIPSEVHILYRYHWDKEIFSLQKWTAKNGVSEPNQNFHLRPGHYQFAIFYKMENADSKLAVYQFD